MRPEILADESVHKHFIRALRDQGYQVRAVREECPGINDKQVLDLAVEHGALLLTEDHDFGEWVFAHKQSQASVILIRYQFPQIQQTIQSLLEVIGRHQKTLFGKFTVIKANRVRIRPL